MLLPTELPDGIEIASLICSNVYQCYDKKGTIVCVKVINFDSPDQEESLKHEKKMLERFNNPNIIPLFGSSISQKFGVLVYPFMRDDLFTFLTQNLSNEKLNEEFWKFSLYNIVETLSFLSNHGIVHRRICLEHILVKSVNEKSAELVLTGFRKSILINPNQRCTDFIDNGIYTAPEVMAHQEYLYPADVYSFGVVLCILLTGENSSNEELCNLSPEAQNLLKICLEEDPNKRISFEHILLHPWFRAVRERNTVPVSMFKHPSID